MKRILIFSTVYHPFIGGAEVAVKEITDRIEDMEFVMITARMKRGLIKHERIGNVDIYRIGIGIPIFDKFLLALLGHKKALKLHKEKKFDLAWSIMASYCGFATLKFKEKINVPFLLTLQEGDPFEYILKKVRFVKKRFEKIFTSADGLQAISNYLLEWGKDMGFRGGIAEVVPNGVDLAKFQKTNIKKQINNNIQIINIKKEIGIEEDAKIIITASRLVKKNGVGDLIRAMTELSADVHLLIAGTGELEGELRKQVMDLKIDERVHFLGNLNHDELPKYLWASDIFCRPSLSEGLGNVFLEAMAVGLPVVGTEVGGIPDFLEDGKTGWFCEVKNPKSIAKKIKYILDENNKDEVEEVIKNARKMVEEKYSWDLISKKMKNIFDSL